MKHIDYQIVSKAFRHRAIWNDADPLSLDGEPIDIYNLSFTSANARHLLGRSDYRCDEHDLCFEGEPVEAQPGDSLIEENIRFRYPLVRETSSGKPLSRHDRVIILLHGLNERTFTKYLPWAYQLWARTGTPVLLFPLAFHINRLPDWTKSQRQVFEKRRHLAGNDCAHRFNAVISERLESHPERLFWGALQSYLDLVDLTREIRLGRHPHFSSDTRVDLLGFSAGGYLTLLLMLEDPESLFTDSRAVVFASGVAARDLNLSSPFILDLAAEVALRKMYVENIDRLPGERLKHWFESHAEGRWMRTLCGQQPDTRRLEGRLKEIMHRVLGISNVNDNVMPSGPMLNILQGLRGDTGVRVAEFDLGVHESPFVCPNYEQPSRRFITEFLDEERYGEAFENFIDESASHLR